MTRSLILICIFILAACSNDSETYYESFDMPVHPLGSHVLSGNDKYMMSKTINYDIPDPISPDEVYKYYIQKFAGIGFEENMRHTFYTFEVNDSDYIKDGNWKEPPAIFHKGWLDGKKTTIIKVSLSYKAKSEVHVGILMHPYVDPQLFEEFQGYLKTTGQENEFYNLYSKYPGQGNTLNIKKALKHEPNNAALITYDKFDKQCRTVMVSNYSKFNKK